MTDQERARIHAQLDVLLGLVPRGGIWQRQAEYERLDTKVRQGGSTAVPGAAREPYPTERLSRGRQGG